MVLWGCYVEELHNNFECQNSLRIRTIGHMAYSDSESFHKIHKMMDSPTYTLAIVGKRKKEEWGYITKKGFVDHKTYRKNKGGF